VTRLTFPIVECKNCGRYVYYDPGAMCWACEAILDDDVMLADDEPWHRSEADG